MVAGGDALEGATQLDGGEAAAAGHGRARRSRRGSDGEEEIGNGRRASRGAARLPGSMRASVSVAVEGEQRERWIEREEVGLGLELVRWAGP